MKQKDLVLKFDILHFWDCEDYNLEKYTVFNLKTKIQIRKHTQIQMARGRKSKQQMDNESEKPMRRRKSKESYSVYVYKVLKQVHPEVGISKKAMNIMNHLMADTFSQLNMEASNITRSSGRQTVSAHAVQAAVQLCFPGDLAKHAV